jgi:hypothetical protein
VADDHGDEFRPCKRVGGSKEVVANAGHDALVGHLSDGGGSPMTVRHIGELHGGRKGSGGEHGDRQSDAHGTGGKTTSFHFKSIPF